MKKCKVLKHCLQPQDVLSINMKIKHFLLIIGIAVILILVLSCSSKQKKEQELTTLSPEQVVELYYMSLDSEDYATMYSLISNGFKTLEPTAKDFPTFKSSMAKFYESFTGVRINKVKETSNDGKKASVDYSIALFSADGTKEFKSAFTLKMTPTGWKLIHPYGEHVDNSS